MIAANSWAQTSLKRKAEDDNQVTAPNESVGTPVHSEPQALPHWNGSFVFTIAANRTATQQTYPYTMVGTDPSGPAATTIVRAILVPLRMEFSNGSIFDASADITGPLNTSVINNVMNSPQFTPSSVYAGRGNLGNTQFSA